MIAHRTSNLTPALRDTLSVLAKAHASLSTTELLDAGWVGRSALRARLVKLEASGLVTRVRGRGRTPDRWTVTSKGIIVASSVKRAA